MLVVFNFFQTIAFYGFGNWVPAIMASKGANITNSLQYSTIIALMYPVGPLLFTVVCGPLRAQMADRGRGHRHGRRSVCSSHGRPATAWLIIFGMLITFSNNLLSYSFHAYQAELYPDSDPRPRDRLRLFLEPAVHNVHQFHDRLLSGKLRHERCIRVYRRQHADGHSFGGHFRPKNQQSFARRNFPLVRRGIPVENSAWENQNPAQRTQ